METTYDSSLALINFQIAYSLKLIKFATEILDSPFRLTCQRSIDGDLVKFTHLIPGTDC